MAVALTQVITEDRASGAQVIDGSLKFDNESKGHHLTKTYGSDGNRQLWTWSAWVKLGRVSDEGHVFESYAGSGDVETFWRFNSNNKIRFGQFTSGYQFQLDTTATFADPSAWYHIVIVYDSNNSTASDRARIYVNGERITEFDTANYPSSGLNSYVFKSGYPHYYCKSGLTTRDFGGYLSQAYLIEGQALDASNFGFTDPLTNTWRPKKYTGTYGTNGFYLPMDGNSPVGEDKSGNGNDFTPVNFGGFNTIEKATGALPILNTTNGGKVAVPGVFGSKVSKTLTTTASTNTSNGFVFANEGTKPTLSFVRGATYTFDYSASTGHPLRFATAADAAGSTEYTDGTDTSVSNTVKITVPHNAPDTLYYYCTNHGGMGNSISVTTDEKVADPYAWKNFLALPLVGNSDDVSHLLNCTSTEKTIVDTNASASSLASNFYGGAYHWDGSGDAVGALDHADFVLGSNDFTMEAWVYPEANAGTGASAHTIFSQWDNSGNQRGFLFRLSGSTNQGEFLYTTDGAIGVSLTIGHLTVPTNKWSHVAAVRNGTTFTYYINGIADPNTSTISEGVSIFNSSDSILIGNQFASGSIATSNSFDGLIQDARIYFGVAKYTSNFIPASTDPDILPDTPSGVAGSSALTKITDGAVSFDGSGDSLILTDDGGLDPGSGDFTLECFINTNNISGERHYPIIQKGNTAANNSYDWRLYFNDTVSGTSHLWFDAQCNSTYRGIPSGGTNLAVGRWYHAAVTRQSGTFRLFLDGILQGSNSDTTDALDNDYTQIEIGFNDLGGAGDTYLDGYVSNVRFVKGTALYTSNFTPPTRALTNITNTTLLCCQSTTSAGTAAVAPTIANNPNDGSIWSEVGTRSGTIIDWTSGFDGSRSTQTSNTSNTAAVITFDPVIPCSTATIWGNTGGSTAVIRINGTSVGGDGQNANPLKQLNTVDVSAQGGVQTISLQGTSDGYAAKMGALICNPGAGEVDAANGAKEVIPVGNAAATNFNPFATDINAVRGQETSYPTLNPLFRQADVVLSDGNLDFIVSANSSAKVAATIGLSTSQGGKYYWEVTQTSNTRVAAGVMNVVGTGYGFANTNDIGLSPHEWGIRFSNSPSQGAGTAMQKSHNNTVTDFGNIALENGDTLQIALDLDNTSIWFGGNGSWIGGSPETNSGATYTNLTGEIVPLVQRQTGTSGCKINFGQKPFKYAPPEGFKTLCLANLPRPTKIALQPDKYFNTVLWTGNAANRNINVGFNPGLVWIKNRDVADHHALFDSTRNVLRYISSNNANTETYLDNTLTSFNSDGFTLGSANLINYSSQDYVAWCWKAGDTASSNTDGTITSTVSANPDAGFSVVTYTGTGANATVGHGLGVGVDFILIKSRSNGSSWQAGHSGAGWTKYAHLDLTNAFASASSVWQDTAPTSTVFSLGTETGVNGLNRTYVAYCFAEVEGYSKFGSYTGNGSADGVYIHLGFRPKWFMLKRADVAGGDWVIMDDERSPFNVMDDHLMANSDLSERVDSTETDMDFLSNGVKLRNSNNKINYSGQTFIYAAFAEAPTNNLYGGQANAR